MCSLIRVGASLFPRLLPASDIEGRMPASRRRQGASAGPGAYGYTTDTERQSAPGRRRPARMRVRRVTIVSSRKAGQLVELLASLVAKPVVGIANFFVVSPH